MYQPVSNLVGTVEDAVYVDPGIEEYRGNPLIEALPLIKSPVEVIKYMKNNIKCSPEERELPPEQRLHLVMRLSHFLQPFTRHITTEQSISVMIRQGYLSRNPKDASHSRTLRHIMLSHENPEVAEMERKLFPVPQPTSSGLAVVGISGLGKSTTIERILAAYPQVINHRTFGHSQVVWLKLDCPHDGSLKGLCLKFFQALDELFGTHEAAKLANTRAMTAEKLLIKMKLRALSLSLGILVIDEIQNLNEASSGGEKKMLNFFVELINEIGVPVVLIGTPSIERVFRKTLRDGRRLTGTSITNWERMKPEDKEWQAFIHALWRFQWTKNYTGLTGELSNLMYNATQGITDLVVKLFILCQFRAIASNSEIITASLIRQVAGDAFAHIKPVLDAITSGKKSKLSKYPDVYAPVDLTHYLQGAIDSQENGEGILAVNHEDEVAEWIVAAGIDRQLAQRVAKDTKCDDLQAWRLQALQSAISKTDEVPDSNVGERTKESVDQPTVKAVNKVHTPLLDAVNRGKKSRKTIYGSLRDEGYVIDPVKLFVTR